MTKYLVHPTSNGYAVVMHTPEGDQVTVDTTKSIDAAKRRAALWTRREAQAAKKGGRA